MLGFMCCEAWQTARPGGNTSLICHGPHNSAQRVNSSLAVTFTHPQLLYRTFTFFPCLSSAYQYIVKPSFSPSILKIVTLQCKSCLHAPCRAEAHSGKTAMWGTGYSGYHNTQLSFVRSSTSCDVFIFLSAGCQLIQTLIFLTVPPICLELTSSII